MADREVLDRVEFYAQDVQLLRDLGHDVQIATRVSEIRPADLYFIWWWTWAAFPITFARLLRRPTIVTGVFDPWAFDDRPRREQALMKYALRHASANVFVAHEEFVELESTYNAPRASHVPLTVAADYSPGEFTRRDSNSLFSVMWLTEGNAQRKCASELLRALALIRVTRPDVRLSIAGEQGSAMPGLWSLICALKLDEAVDFLGPISRADKIERLQSCAVYMQPSRYEGFGMAILEAMACGAPVVTSAVGEVPHVVGDGGVFVDGSSPEAIAAATLKLVDSAENRRKLGSAARARAVAIFAPAQRRAAFGKLIEDALGKPS